MTEATENGVDPSTFTTVREHRHYVHGLLDTVSNRLGSAAHKLRGQVGLSQEEQVARFEQANARVTEATDAVGPVVSAIEAGRDFAAGRDFEAHQAAKVAARGTYQAPSRPSDGGYTL